MTDIVFTPTSKKVSPKQDALVAATANGIAHFKCNEQLRWIGNGKLGEMAEGGTLWIVGHGFAGKKIGAHGFEGDAKGPHDLVRLLEKEGLPKKPEKPVTIHLHACATGSSVRVSYSLWRQDPYAVKFARYLADEGFTNYFVVGYAGFMNSSGQHSLSYHVQSPTKRIWSGTSQSDAPTILLEVENGRSRWLEGDEWKQFTSFTPHRGRANSTVLSIRKAA